MPSLEFFVKSNRKGKSGPLPLDGLNELIAAERAGYGPSLKRKNGRHAQRACAEAMAEQGWETPDGRCRVTLTFVEPHRGRDPDNVYGGAKFILDGITMPRGRKEHGAGAIVDDSQKWIELALAPIEVGKVPGCRVLIETI